MSAVLEKERYLYQYDLPNWGDMGQLLMQSSHVAVVGAGGLGSFVVPMLTRIGVGQITVIDNDKVELANLHRQSFHLKDIEQNKYKVESLYEECKCINENVLIDFVTCKLTKQNIEELLSLSDVIVDGLDNWETRYLINDYSVNNAIPYVYAGVRGTIGMMKVILPKTFNSESLWEKEGVTTADLRTTFGDLIEKKEVKSSKRTMGILAPVLPIMANLQVIEVMKILTCNFKSVNRNLVVWNGWDSSWQSIKDNNDEFKSNIL